MKQDKLKLPDPGFTLKPSPRPPEKRVRKGKKLVWLNEKVKGNTGGLQLPLFKRKGQQTNIWHQRKERRWKEDHVITK